MTTTQKLALTPANGMMIYDITLNEFFPSMKQCMGKYSYHYRIIHNGGSTKLNRWHDTSTGTIGLNPVFKGLTAITLVYYSAKQFHRGY